VLVTQNFLENRKAKHYQELIEDRLSKFEDVGVKMSIKVQYLFIDFDQFSGNLGQLSEEHGERLHQVQCPHDDRQLLEFPT